MAVPFPRLQEHWGTDGDQQSVGYNGATLLPEGPFANTWANLAVASPVGFGQCAFDPRAGVRITSTARVFT